LRAAGALLIIDGDDVLEEHARTVAGSILKRLPTHEIRQRFQAAEVVRRLGRLDTFGESRC
jgi:hypothetical protein